MEYLAGHHYIPIRLKNVSDLNSGSNYRILHTVSTSFFFSVSVMSYYQSDHAGFFTETVTGGVVVCIFVFMPFGRLQSIIFVVLFYGAILTIYIILEQRM